MIPALTLATLAALSFLLSVWQLVVAWRFPLHRRAAAPDPGLRSPNSKAPGVSILKPLKGCDAATIECLRSWLTQEYDGPVEVLFGVADEQDPVCAIVRELLAAHPAIPARLVVCRPRLGPNAKASTLAYLERLACHDVIGVSDADVWAPPDFLAQTTATLREDPAVGLVNAFYQMANPAGLAMRCEAFAVNADFWSQVLQARCLGPMRFALGAAMVLRRGHLEACGGFRGLTGFLADDYQLGQRLAQGGGRIELATVVVECRSSPQGARAVWAHQLRWARTIRACRPVGYFFSLLGNVTLWPALWMLTQPPAAGWAAAGALLSWRMFQGFLLERRMTGRASVASCGLAPVKDLMQVGMWGAAFLGDRVDWGGESLHVGPQGRLLDPAAAAEATAPPRFEQI